MTFRSKPYLSTISVGLFLIISICCNHSEKGATTRAVTIGVLGPFTGEGATYGAAMRQGVDLALKELRVSPSWAGKGIAAAYEDDKLSSKEGINAFRKLVDVDHVQAVIGSAGSSVSLAIAPLANESRVVLFSPISTADALENAGEYFFRNIPPNRNQAKTAAYFIAKYLGKTKVAVFYENNDYGNNMKTILNDFIGPLRGEILISLPYESGQRDFKDALAKIKAVKPEVVFIPGTYQENGLIVSQARNMNLDVPFIGGDGAYSPQFIELAGKASEGFFLTMIALPTEQASDAIGRFYGNFRAAYQREPDIYSALSYDAAMMIAKAIELNGNVGSKIKDTLRTIEYVGITGLVKFDSHGEVDKPYRILNVKNRQFVLLDWEPRFGD